MGTVLKNPYDSIYSISNNIIVLHYKPWFEEGLYLATHLTKDLDWKGEEEEIYEQRRAYTIYNAKIRPVFVLIVTKPIRAVGEEIFLHFEIHVDD